MAQMCRPPSNHDSIENSERQLLERYAQRCRAARQIARLIGLHHTSVIRRLKKYPDPDRGTVALTQLPQLEGENKFFAGMGFGNT